MTGAWKISNPSQERSREISAGKLKTWLLYKATLRLPSGKLTQLWKITIFNGKIHYKWSFSIAMLIYQRVLLLDTSGSFLVDSTIFYHTGNGRVYHFSFLKLLPIPQKSEHSQFSIPNTNKAHYVTIGTGNLNCHEHPSAQTHRNGILRPASTMGITNQ